MDLFDSIIKYYVYFPYNHSKNEPVFDLYDLGNLHTNFALLSFYWTLIIFKIIAGHNSFNKCRWSINKTKQNIYMNQTNDEIQRYDNFKHKINFVFFLAKLCNALYSLFGSGELLLSYTIMVSFKVALVNWIINIK